MKTHILENTHMKRNYPDGFTFDFGWGNGYVLLDKEHPWYEKHYDDIDVEVHGGLTFSEKINEQMIDNFKLSPEDIGKWMIGFDTCHYQDTLKRWPKEKVQEEANRLLEQCKKAITNDIT
jgi:hypothetical protein